MENDIHRTAMPAIGSQAPNFEADSTFGKVSLSDYKGKWLILFSHPGDFTPVCTTEFLAFQKMLNDFKMRGCELLGLSVDSNASHLAWVYNIYQRTGVEIGFPIVDDRGAKIAHEYGMISDAVNPTATVRTVFFICPMQRIRAIITYPMTTGRCIPEILRVIDALQTADKESVATPANWVPGMAVVAIPPHTWHELMERVSNPGALCCMDWYLCLTDTGA